MATPSRSLAKIFCTALGLDPGVVRSFRIDADAQNGIVIATVVMYPTLSDMEMEALAQAALKHGDEFQLNMERGHDGTA